VKDLIYFASFLIMFITFMKSKFEYEFDSLKKKFKNYINEVTITDIKSS